MYIWCLLSCAFSEISLFMAQFQLCTCSFLGSKLKLNKPSNTVHEQPIKSSGQLSLMMYRILAKLLATVANFFSHYPQTDQTCIVELYKFRVEHDQETQQTSIKRKKSFLHSFRCLHFLLCSLIQHFVDKYAKLLYLPIFLIKAEILHYITSSRSVFFSLKFNCMPYCFHY